MNPLVLFAVGSAGYLALKAQEKGNPVTTKQQLQGSSTKKKLADISATLSKYKSSTPFDETKNGAAISDKIAAKAKAAWEKASGDAKKKACEKMKKEFPNSPEIQALDCGSSTYKQVATAVGAAGGVAACSATGAGVTVASLCGAVGAKVGEYLGEKTKEWANDAYDEVSEWAGDAVDEVGGWLGF